MGVTTAEGSRVERTSLLSRVLSWDRTAFLTALGITVATRLAFFVVAWGASWLFETGTVGPPTTGWLEMWERWDARHLVDVANDGYLSGPEDANSTAFFPAFVLAMRWLSWTGLPTAAAGMLISFVGTVVACTYLYKLAERELGEGSGRRAALYLTVFPTAVFLIAPYTEALFLAGAIPAFYYARSEKWLAVGPFAALAMASRFAGIFLIAGLAAEFIRQRDFKLDRTLNAITSLLAGGLPLLAYSLFMVRQTGDPFHFLSAQKEGWGRQFVGLEAAFLNTWRTWEGGYYTNWMLAWRLEIIAALIGACLVLWAILKKEFGYAVYMGTALGVLVTSSWYYSIPRIILTWFPVMLFLTEFSKRREGRHEMVLIGMVPVATLGVILFTRSIWFF